MSHKNCFEKKQQQENSSNSNGTTSVLATALFER